MFTLQRQQVYRNHLSRDAKITNKSEDDVQSRAVLRASGCPEETTAAQTPTARLAGIRQDKTYLRRRGWRVIIIQQRDIFRVYTDHHSAGLIKVSIS